MATFLLDSDILDYLENGESPFHRSCVDGFARHVNDHLCISILTVFEFDYRLASADSDMIPLLTAIKVDILKTYEVIPLSLAISERYGRVKAAYRQHSKAKAKAMKGYTVDMILAATALEHDAIVVSNDQIFATLSALEPTLTVDNWAQPPVSP